MPEARENPLAEVEEVLPYRPKVFKRPLADGFVLTNPADPPPLATHFARELTARFVNKRLAELRVHYIDVPGKGGLNKLQTALKNRGGAPEKLTPSWLAIWADLPAQKPAPLLQRWQDDATLITCQRDLAGMEVVEVSPPYDHAEITALLAHRLVLEALSGMALRRLGRDPQPERSR